MNKACQQYNTKELCELFNHVRSSYYYQAQDKSMNDGTKVIIKSMKQISLETGYTYGRRRLQRQLNSEGHQIGIHRTTTLMNKANIKAIRPKKRHYYLILASCIKEPTIYLIVILINKKATHIG